jgi:hypothetical protein
MDPPGNVDRQAFKKRYLDCYTVFAIKEAIRQDDDEPQSRVPAVLPLANASIAVTPARAAPRHQITRGTSSSIARHPSAAGSRAPDAQEPAPTQQDSARHTDQPMNLSRLSAYRTSRVSIPGS